MSERPVTTDRPSQRARERAPLVPLALVGCDFRVAPTSVRARLTLSAEERGELARGLASAAGASGFAALDTCNRTEWIVETPHPDWTAELLAAQMRRRLGAASAPGALPYAHVGPEAARHFLRVAAGLESLALGEREIAGQCFRAIDLAREQGHGSRVLDQLAHAAGRTVRRLERLGRFREASRGVAGLAVDFVLARLSRPAPIVGVAGLGQMGKKCAQALESRGARVLQFNRTPRHERCLPLPALAANLSSLDALIVATGAAEPTLHLPPGLARERALLVVDLGVPAQVSAPSSDATGFDLIGLDALPLGERAAQAPGDVELATESVELGVSELLLACERRRAARLLEAVHAKREELRDARLPGVLDEHLHDLEPARRRKLEAALRSLLSDQQRALLDAIESGPSADAGTAPRSDA